MDLTNLPIGWFDFAAVIFLMVGVLRGRKHGMSQELLLVVQWICIYVACLFGYVPLGTFFSQSTVFSLLFSNILMFVTIALVVRVFFGLVKRALGGKLLGSDMFGSGEYYLGMCAGFVRYTIILFWLLALLNARLVTTPELQAMEKFQVENYGKVYFPGVPQLQQQIFKASFFGELIKKHLSMLLMEPVVAEKKQLHQKEWNMPGA